MSEQPKVTPQFAREVADRFEARDPTDHFGIVAYLREGADWLERQERRTSIVTQERPHAEESKG